jgi:hydrogenase maturation factor HypF (carbamoyltransferase family)
MNQYKVCPKCKQKYTQHSAISRIDNKTNICPTCGIKEEALIQFIKQQNPPRN